jgi:hypothetical protein
MSTYFENNRPLIEDLIVQGDDLMAPSVESSLCLRCGQWYGWDETHIDEKFMVGGGCNWRVLRGE